MAKVKSLFYAVESTLRELISKEKVRAKVLISNLLSGISIKQEIIL